MGGANRNFHRETFCIPLGSFRPSHKQQQKERLSLPLFLRTKAWWVYVYRDPFSIIDDCFLMLYLMVQLRIPAACSGFLELKDIKESQMEPPHIRDFFFLDTATCESLPKFVLVRGKFSDTSSLPGARYMWIKAFIKQLGTKHMSGVLSPGGLNFRRQSKLLHAERRPFSP